MVQEKNMLDMKLKQYNQQLTNQGLLRKRQLTCDPKHINFCSNDYLSLGSDPRIKKAYQEGFQRYASGSGGSMVVCGYHPIHKKLEDAFAEALRVDDCLLFSSGYAANLSVANLLGQLGAYVYIDKCIHASVYDGLKLSKVRYSRYLHNSYLDLSAKVDAMSQSGAIFTESIFSMSGQIAPLTQFANLCGTAGNKLLVDEAHAFGVMGNEGLGGVAHVGLGQDIVPLRVIPFGKAYASQGAIVAGKGEWIEALQQAARPHIYSTSMSPALVFGVLKTLEFVRVADDRRAKLQDLIVYFRDAITASNLQWQNSSTAIQQLQLGCPLRALEFAERLKEHAIFCLPIRQPTVNKKETGLRFVLNYHHQYEHIDDLFRRLSAL